MALTVEKKRKRLPPIEVVPDNSDNPINKFKTKKQFVADEEKRRDINKRASAYKDDLIKEATAKATKDVEGDGDKLAILENKLESIIGQIKNSTDEEEIKALKKKVTGLKMQIGKEKKK